MVFLTLIFRVLETEPMKHDSDSNQIGCLVLARPYSLRNIPVHPRQCCTTNSKISA